MQCEESKDFEVKDKEIEELSRKNESLDKDLEKVQGHLLERTEELDNAKKCQEKQETNQAEKEHCIT